MLIRYVAAMAPIVLILLGSELWWRKRKRPDSELSRKFVHLTVGSYVAFWPFFLGWEQIRLFSIGFALVVLVSMKLGIFKAIHSVQRPTWGEIYFALVVGILPFITHHKGVYAVALLAMGLADGLAAVIGVRYGKSQRYTVFGHPKSIAGTATFFVVSLALLFGYSAVSTPLDIVTMLELSAGAALLENLAIAGLDNLAVPLLIAVVLNNIR